MKGHGVKLIWHNFIFKTIIDLVMHKVKNYNFLPKVTKSYNKSTIEIVIFEQNSMKLASNHKIISSFGDILYSKSIENFGITLIIILSIIYLKDLPDISYTGLDVSLSSSRKRLLWGHSFVRGCNLTKNWVKEERRRRECAL